MSKHHLLQTWPSPITVCDSVSLIGFAIFYSNFIPHFGVRAKRLHETTNLACSEPVALYFNNAAKAECDDIESNMLSDYCMMRFNHRKYLYLHAEFSVISFSYAANQSGDNKESIAVMRRDINDMAGICANSLQRGPS